MKTWHDTEDEESPAESQQQKDAARLALSAAVEEFLAAGGAIQALPCGATTQRKKGMGRIVYGDAPKEFMG